METNKKYYQISVSPEPKIIGVSNGVYQVEIHEKSIEKDHKYYEFTKWFDYKNPNFWENQDKVSTLETPSVKGKMLKKAKLTDIMGYAPEYHGLHDVYSQKFVDILKSFNSEKFNLFDFDIENVPEKYYFMFVKTIPTHDIIFDRSLIYTGHKMTDNLKYHKIDGYQEYRSFKTTTPLARFEKIAIPSNHYGKDLISIQPAVNLFCSERLVDFLLDCKITGLQVAYNNSIQLEFV